LGSSGCPEHVSRHGVLHAEGPVFVCRELVSVCFPDPPKLARPLHEVEVFFQGHPSVVNVAGFTALMPSGLPEKNGPRAHGCGNFTPMVTRRGRKPLPQRICRPWESRATLLSHYHKARAEITVLTADTVGDPGADSGLFARPRMLRCGTRSRRAPPRGLKLVVAGGTSPSVHVIHDAF